MTFNELRFSVVSVPVLVADRSRRVLLRGGSGLRRRALLALGGAALVLAWPPDAPAQTKKASSGGTEAAVRDTIARFEAAWNRHDVKAWLALMTEDVWFTAASDFYGRMKGKEAVRAFFEYDVKNTDLRWEIKQLKMMPDGTASASLRHTALLLPKVDGKYKREDVSDPCLSRWRLEGGRWRLFFFTAYKGLAISEMKKDGLDP
ncbi:nuclear transport factor 2 family protein [Variovorax sp. RT4R15]|uniref:nuclear transport factor 2 family protein n=1 Tax=Variovorax sp. RT4R15 TaxID=3443737 RepID=UPI003F4870C2